MALNWPAYDIAPTARVTSPDEVQQREDLEDPRAGEVQGLSGPGGFALHRFTWGPHLGDVHLMGDVDGWVVQPQRPPGAPTRRVEHLSQAGHQMQPTLHRRASHRQTEAAVCARRNASTSSRQASRDHSG